jgi:hypothetical protein
MSWKAALIPSKSLQSRNPTLEASKAIGGVVKEHPNSVLRITLSCQELGLRNVIGLHERTSVRIIKTSAMKEEGKYFQSVVESADEHFCRGDMTTWKERIRELSILLARIARRE